MDTTGNAAGAIEAGGRDGASPYRLIARAIERLDAAGGERLGLAELAAELGVSPAHFQRVFSRWVGVSPQRDPPYLAPGQARRMLAAGRAVLDTPLAAGLSGPARRYDRFRRCEAMTPGEVARAGVGVALVWGWFDSPFGPALAMGTERGLSAIGFAAEHGQRAVMDDLTGRWPQARYIEDPERLRPWVEAAFGTAGPGVRPPVWPIGTPFQLQVWQALLAIPPGQVATYGQIAAALGRPRAARAVGAAVAANPLAWLIPCHRVIGASGALTGYRWGLPVKRAMLAWEAARAAAG
jgi:AraC family transcriptional regulator of adaptative response/methylated-DNA-[protein]-cysteine methyltransferase